MARHNHESNRNQNILLGIAAGTIVGALTAALVSSKGKEIREGLLDAYHHAGHSVQDAVHNFADTSQSFSDRFLQRQRKPSNLNLTAGAVAGGLLGITAIILLSSKSAKGIRSQFLQSCERLSEKAHDWEDMAQHAAENLEGYVSPWIKKAQTILTALQEKDDSYFHNGKRQKPLDKILDFASAAAQLVQSFKR